MIINPYVYGGLPLLLDTYPNAVGAYSLRKLSSTYTGNAITVRRSSDNTSQNIGFDANGNLDTTTLLSFVGTGNGFVSIWYDQSGNGYNFFQTTSGLQPSIVLGGVICVGVVGKKPAFRFAGQGFKNLTNLIKAEHSIFVTSLSDSLSVMPLISQWSPGVLNRLLYALNQNSAGIQEYNKMNFFIDGVTNGAGFDGYMLEGNISNTSFKLLTSLSSTGSENFKTYINTALVDSATISGVNSTIPTAIGYSDQNSNPYLYSYMNELIIYNSNQLTNRTGIESNINSYYTIY